MKISAGMSIIIAIIALIFFMLILWAFNIAINSTQLALIMIVPIMLLIVYVLLWTKRKHGDEFFEAREYAKEIIEKKLGFKTSIIRSMGTTRYWGVDRFYAFKAERKDARSGIPIVVIVKKIPSGFVTAAYDEMPTDEIIKHPYRLIETIYPGSPVEEKQMMPYPEYQPHGKDMGQKININLRDKEVGQGDAVDRD